MGLEIWLNQIGTEFDICQSLELQKFGIGKHHLYASGEKQGECHVDTMWVAMIYARHGVDLPRACFVYADMRNIIYQREQQANRKHVAFVWRKNKTEKLCASIILEVTSDPLQTFFNNLQLPNPGKTCDEQQTRIDYPLLLRSQNMTLDLQLSPYNTTCLVLQEQLKNLLIQFSEQYETARHYLQQWQQFSSLEN